jgi:hypothetical protein
MAESLGIPEHAALKGGGSAGLASGSVGAVLSSKLDSPGFWAAFGNSLLMIIGASRRS